MEPILTEEHVALRESVREFAARHCPPDRVRKWDEDKYFPREVYTKMAELGYMGIAVDPEYGGSGGDVIAQEIMVEELYRAMQGSAEMWFNTSCFGGESVGAYGTEEQKRKILPSIAQGKLMFAISVTEPGGGTDVLGHMKTIAKKVEGGWVVNGRKIFTTAADIADYILLVTRSKPDSELTRKSDGINVFLFPAKTEGITLKNIPKLSQRTLGHFEVAYDNVFIADEYLLGEPHDGWRLLLHTLNNERILGAAFCLGCAQAALDDSIAYAKVREAYGRPIGSFQAIAHYIANMALAIEQARLLTLKAAWLQSRHLPCGKEATMAKVAASEAASMSADLGMQVLGGYGIATSTDMQRYWRDSRIMRLGPVTNEMGRNFIAMELGLPRSY
jgi:acyl-CoA dehydrogenase